MSLLNFFAEYLAVTCFPTAFSNWLLVRGISRISASQGFRGFSSHKAEKTSSEASSSSNLHLVTRWPTSRLPDGRLKLRDGHLKVPDGLSSLLPRGKRLCCSLAPIPSRVFETPQTSQYCLKVLAHRKSRERNMEMGIDESLDSTPDVAVLESKMLLETFANVTQLSARDRSSSSRSTGSTYAATKPTIKVSLSELAKFILKHRRTVALQALGFVTAPTETGSPPSLADIWSRFKRLRRLYQEQLVTFLRSNYQVIAEELDRAASTAAVCEFICDNAILLREKHLRRIPVRLQKKLGKRDIDEAYLMMEHLKRRAARKESWEAKNGLRTEKFHDIDSRLMSYLSDIAKQHVETATLRSICPDHLHGLVKRARSLHRYRRSRGDPRLKRCTARAASRNIGAAVIVEWYLRHISSEKSRRRYSTSDMSTTSVRDMHPRGETSEPARKHRQIEA